MGSRRCAPECDCRRHGNRGGSAKCVPNCTCSKHDLPPRGPMPQERKEKIAVALLGRKNGPPSQATRDKISAALTGTKHSAEFVEKCRQRQLGTGAGFYYDYGYRFLTQQQGHPLANTEGIVAEHRKVLYDLLGPGPHPCHWVKCGELALEWGGGSGINVDHLNGIKDDNRPENLVPSCRSCNRVGRRLGRGI